MLKPVLIVLGSFSLALGVIGMFLPGLPTTPFVLLSAGLYVKSSPVLYQKVKNNRILGQYMNIPTEGVSLKFKIFSITIMWLMILLSAFTVFSEWEWRLLLFTLGIIGTYFKLRLPNRKE